MNVFNRGILTRSKLKIRFRKVITGKKKMKDGSVKETFYTYEVADKTNVYYTKDLFMDLLYRYEGEDKHKIVAPNTLRLFLYIVFKVEADSDHITLSERILKKEINMSKSSYDTARSELLKLGIIHPVDDKQKTTEFWINTNHLFKGGRLKYYENNYPKRLVKIP